MSYVCRNSVTMIIFNRPQLTREVFNQVRKVKPPRLYVISDGPRTGHDSDHENVQLCREIVTRIDWQCEVVRVYSDGNLGCKKRVMTGLDRVFQDEEATIILEDDCVPTEAFFRFCDWGLARYWDDDRIGMISGSNLLDYDSRVAHDDRVRAGFSMYINCWGWATWRRVWNEVDQFLSIQELNQSAQPILQSKPLTRTQRAFWIGVFRHSISSRTIWDFYLQYEFFENSFVSVYPLYNLVSNVGFSDDATHTKHVPEFVRKSWPRADRAELLMDLREPDAIILNRARDNEVIRRVYGCSTLSTLRLSIGNILRYCGVLW